LVSIAIAGTFLVVLLAHKTFGNESQNVETIASIYAVDFVATAVFGVARPDEGSLDELRSRGAHK